MLAKQLEVSLQSVPMDWNPVIDALGTTTEVARLCRVKPQAVSQWRVSGIPSARLDFLKLARPDLPWANLLNEFEVHQQEAA